MTTEKKTRRTYTEDFKRDAITLIKVHGYKVSDAARSIDIDPNLLGRWIREARDKESVETLSGDELEELKMLRKENRDLKLEKDILKKASAYFAREMK